MSGKRQWHLVVEDSTDYEWSYFLKEKSQLKDVVMLLSKDSKVMYDVNVRYVHYNNASENEAFK